MGAVCAQWGQEHDQIDALELVPLVVSDGHLHICKMTDEQRTFIPPRRCLYKQKTASDLLATSGVSRNNVPHSLELK